MSLTHLKQKPVPFLLIFDCCNLFGYNNKHIYFKIVNITLFLKNCMFLNCTLNINLHGIYWLLVSKYTGLARGITLATLLKDSENMQACHSSALKHKYYYLGFGFLAITYFTLATIVFPYKVLLTLSPKMCLVCLVVNTYSYKSFREFCFLLFLEVRSKFS